ncbi:hypothetical protein DOT_5177 [Desulfosporosinus sp. OT]|nr:hypothetical protein DOT_5177 [Desulfosporosinus sp. OT]
MLAPNPAIPPATNLSFFIGTIHPLQPAFGQYNMCNNFDYVKRLVFLEESC